MTIRKISGATSSIITKAQLVVGTPGIFKASVTRNQLLATVQTEIDIVKSALIAPRTIDHLLYDDEGSSRFLREFILIGSQDRISVGLTKAFSDLVVMLDVADLARLALGASARDTVNANEQTFFAVDKSLVDNFNPVEAISKGIQNAVIDALLPQTDRATLLPGKGINDSLTAQDQNLNFGYGFTYRDSFEAVELKSLAPNKARFDSFNVADARVNVLAGKYFYDAFGTLDLAGVFDGITYNAIMHREDVSTIYEYLAFAIDTKRAYLDNVLIDSRPSLEPGLVKTDLILTDASITNKQIGVGRSDSFSFSELLKFNATTKYTDTFAHQDATAFNVDLVLIGRDNNVAIPSDATALQASLLKAEQIFAQQNKQYFNITKYLADAFTPISLASVSDGGTFLLDRHINEFVTITDLMLNFVFAAQRIDNFIANDVKTVTIGKGLFDSTVIDQTKVSFSVAKTLADSFAALSLSTVFDGNIFSFGHYVNDIEIITDQQLNFVITSQRRFFDLLATTDAKSLEPNKGLFDFVLADESKALFASKLNVDTEEILDIKALYLQKSAEQDSQSIFDVGTQLYTFKDLFNTANVAEAKTFVINKDLDDASEAIEYFARKFDAIRGTRDGFVETFLTNSRTAITPGKASFDEIINQDLFKRIFVSARTQEDTTESQDRIYKLEQRNPAHAIIAADLGYTFYIAKGINDPVNMLDLTGTFDGSKYTISMDKTEDQPVYEYYRPKWRIRRRGRDGFLEEVVITDAFSINRLQEIDPLANYVYVHGDNGFRYTPSGGQHYYNGINGELFLFLVAPEWTTFDITLGRFEDQPTPDVFRRVVTFIRNPYHNDLIGGGSDGFANAQPMTDVSANSPYPARFFSTRIPSPTKGDTTSTAVAVGGVAYPPAENLLRYSESIGNASWDLSNGSVTIELENTNYTNPVGGVTGVSKLEPTANNRNLGQTVEANRIIVGQVYTFSVYLIATAGALAISVDDGSGTYAVSTTVPSTAPANAAWARYSVTFTAITTSVKVYIGNATAWDLLETVWAWGAQLNTGSSAGTYVKTLASPTIWLRNQPGLETTNWFATIDAKAGAQYTTSSKTVDFVIPNANFKIRSSPAHNSSVGTVINPKDRDQVGTVDFQTYTYQAGRRSTDGITIGADRGFRYQASENTSETVKFTITKLAGDSTSISYPNTQLVIIGRGTTSVAYPERRSGDQLDNPAFTVNLRAKPSILVTVSSETVQAMSSSEGIFVGQRSWMGNAGGFRNAGDSQERIVFLLSKDNSGRDSIAIGLSSTATGIRTQPTESSLENTRFTVVKAPGLQGAYDTTLVTIGYGDLTERPRTGPTIIGNIVTGEGMTFVITKERFDRDVAGTTGAVVTAGRNSSIASVAYPERRSGDKLDNAAFDFYKTAFAGSSVTWTVQLNTIDPSPDIEYQASSVTITYGPKDVDRIGMLDRFNLFYTVGRIFDQDFVTIGTDTGFRYQPTESALENTKFFVIKGLSDTVPMLDLTGIFDGLNSFVTIFKTESSTILDVSANSPYPARFMSKNIGVGNHNGTVDIFYIGVSSTATGIRTQPTESALENTKFTIVKAPGQNGVDDTSVVTVGNWQTLGDRTISTSELVTFNVTKLALQGVDYSWAFGTTTSRTTAARGDLVYAGDPTFGGGRSRLSGSTFERIGFDFFKTAFAGSSVTWSIQINTIDPNPDVEYQQSSVTLSYGPKDLDAVGSLDRFFLTLATRRTFDLDFITIGGDRGLRYQQYENSSETIKFTVAKLAGNPTTTSISTSYNGSAQFNGASGVNLGANFVVPRTGPSYSGTELIFPGDFTVEGWFYPTTVTGERTLFVLGEATGVGYLVKHTDAQLNGRLFGGTVYNWNNVTVNTWHHIAIVRSGTTITCYFNGVANSSTDTQAGTIGTGYMRIGGQGSLVTDAFSGNITNFRVSNAAIYTSNFTPPTTQLTATSSTQLLMLTESSATLNADSSQNNFNILNNRVVFSTISTPLATITTSVAVYSNTHPVIIGRGTTNETYPERRSGDSLDNPAFTITLDAKVNSSSTFSYSVSGVTVLGRDRERLFVGQQSWQGNAGGFRNAGDRQERLFYTLSKVADQDGLGSSLAYVVVGSDNGFRYTPSMSNTSETVKFTFIKAPGRQGAFDTSVVTVGNWQTIGDRTISSSELVTFTITQLAKQGAANTWSGYINNSSFTTTAADRGERVYVGDPFQGVYPLRRSGAQAEKVGFDFFKTAFAGSSVTWSIKINTIDSDPDFEWRDSSVTAIYGPKDTDAIGMWDRWWMVFTSIRSGPGFFDFVTVGTDNGFRYQTGENSSETVKFTITKSRFDKDVPGTTGAIVTLLDDLTIFPGRNFFESLTISDNSRFSPYPAKDFFKTTGIGGAGSSNTIVIIGSGVDSRLGFTTEKAAFVITKSRFDFDVPGTTGAVVTVGWGEAVERPRTGPTIVGNVVSGEGTTFAINKLAEQSVNNTWSGYINSSSFSTTAADNGERVYVGDPFRGIHPLRRSGAQAENVSVQYIKDAKRGATTTPPLLQFVDGNNGSVSAAVVTFAAPDTDVVGVYAGIVDVRAFTRRFPLYTRNSAGEVIDNQTGETEIVVPNDDSANSPYPAKRLTKRVYPDDDATTSHHLVYTTGDVETIQFTKSARRGVAGTLILNTIDPNPDVEWQQSSVSLVANAWDADAVGTLDYFSIYYMLYRQFDEYLTLGSGIDQRQTTTENIKFLFTKLLSGDTTPMLDLTEVYDGLVYTSALYKADTQIISSGQTSQTFPARTKSGATERVSFDVVKAAEYSGNTITFSGNTVTAGDTDRLFVGQQYGTTRFARDPQERILFTVSTILGNARDTSVQTIATMGRGTTSVDYPERVSGDNLDTAKFTFTKTKFDKDVAGTTGAIVVVGRESTSQTFPERRSGDSLDNPAFVFYLDAKRATTSGSITVKTIDPTDGNGFQSSTTITYLQTTGRSAAPDATGIFDFMFIVAAIGRAPNDFITIGTDTGFRYQSSENTSETVKFTIGKRANEYDGSTSYVTMGWGDLVERPRTGITYSGFFGDTISGEAMTFAITKLAKEYNGTTANVIIGRGATSVAYPERRSGDSLDNPAFDFFKTAQYKGINTSILGKWVSPFSGTTLVTTAFRASDTVDRLYIGSQGYKRQADIISNSSTTNNVYFSQVRNNGGFVSGNTYTFSVYLRRPEYAPQTGMFLQAASTSLAITFATSITVTNTWARYQLTFNAPRTSLTVIVNTSGAPSTIDDVEVFGAQIVAGSAPGTYTRTTTTTSAANLLLYSEDFDNAAWVKNTGTAVYPNYTPAPDEFWTTVDWARPGDSQEELYYTVGKQADSDGAGSSLAFVTMGAGDNYGFRYQQYENSSETVKFTVGKFAKEYDGTTSYVMMGRGVTTAAYPERQQPTESSLENTFFDITLTAKRGVAGNVTLNTIDPNPDVEFFVSSVTISRGDWQLDEVGMLDRFNLFYQITRTIDQDFVTIGLSSTATGIRTQPTESRLEFTTFLIGKLLGDDTAMLDLTEVYDGLVYNSTILKRETQIMGFGSSTGVKVTGSLLENIPFDVYKDIKQGSSTTNTVSGTTVTASDRDRIFVGQQSWQGNTGGRRNSGDTQERIFYTIGKFAKPSNNPDLTTIGYGDLTERPRTGPTIIGNIVTGEGMTFVITKERFDRDVAGTTGAIVVMGRESTSQTYPERRSGDSLDNPAFLYGMRANRGVTGTVTLKLIDPINGDAGQSSAAVTYQDWDYDVVGAVDFMFVQMIGTGRAFLDSILIGSDTGFRYQQYENSSETVKFTITKFAKEYDGTTSYAQIGWGDLAERARVGTLTVDVNNNLYGETTKFDIIKTRVDKSAGTTGSVITVGRGTSSVAYPERRSGDNIDSPDFFFSLDAKAGRLSETYTVSGVTVLARDRDRVFVGQQSWQGNTAIRNAGDTQERIFYTVGKKADQDGLGSSTAFVVMGAGNNYGFRYQTGENTSETVKFTVTKSRFDKDVAGTTGALVVMGRGTSSVAYPERRSGDDLDHVVFDYVMTAKRGVAGNVTLNTIDPNPDVEFFVSSVTVSRGDWQLDEVGMLDRFNLFYVVTRAFDQDLVTIGSDTGFRYQPSENTSETVRFTIGKNFGRFGGHPFDAAITGEGSTMLDVTDLYDGLVYNTTMLKTESQTIGRGTTSVSYPEKRSGQTLEIAQFLFSLDAKVDRLSASYTVSGVTVLARDRDRLFVGQQPWQGNTATRNAGDRQERILFTVAKSADQNGLGSSTAFVVAGAGDNYGFRYQASENTSETVKFTITKSNFDRDVAGTTGAIVTMGRGISSATYPEKRSGQTDEIAQFLFNLDAKQSLLTTVSGTTVQARDRDRVFMGQQSWQGNQGKRVSGDALESFVINLYKPFTETSTTILDRTALYGQKGGIADDLTMLGDGLEFMNLNFFSPKVDSTEITDLLVINVVFPVNVFDYPGDLDLNGNINTVASYGNLRMTDYADIAYFDDDYVGEKRSFT